MFELKFTGMKISSLMSQSAFKQLKGNLISPPFFLFFFFARSISKFFSCSREVARATPCGAELCYSRSLTSGFHYSVDGPWREMTFSCSLCCGLDLVGWFVPLSTSFCHRRWLFFDRIWAGSTKNSSNISKIKRKMLAADLKRAAGGSGLTCWT